jgi:hypothetical protein
VHTRLYGYMKLVHISATLEQSSSIEKSRLLDHSNENVVATELFLFDREGLSSQFNQPQADKGNRMQDFTVAYSPVPSFVSEHQTANETNTGTHEE